MKRPVQIRSGSILHFILFSIFILTVLVWIRILLKFRLGIHTTNFFYISGISGYTLGIWYFTYISKILDLGFGINRYVMFIPKILICRLYIFIQPINRCHANIESKRKMSKHRTERYLFEFLRLKALQRS